jgi:hypothetical protein
MAGPSGKPLTQKLGIKPGFCIFVSGAPVAYGDIVVRDIALPLGLVDIKVCAIDEVWSGLKFVIRSELRASKGTRRGGRNSNWHGVVR